MTEPETSRPAEHEQQGTATSGVAARPAGGRPSFAPHWTIASAGGIWLLARLVGKALAAAGWTAGGAGLVALFVPSLVVGLVAGLVAARLAERRFLEVILGSFLATAVLLGQAAYGDTSGLFVVFIAQVLGCGVAAGGVYVGERLRPRAA